MSFIHRSVAQSARPPTFQSDPMQASCQMAATVAISQTIPGANGQTFSGSFWALLPDLPQFQSAVSASFVPWSSGRPAARPPPSSKQLAPLSSADLTTPFPLLGLLNYGYGAFAPTHFRQGCHSNATEPPPSLHPRLSMVRSFGWC